MNNNKATISLYNLLNGKPCGSYHGTPEGFKKFVNTKIYLTYDYMEVWNAFRKAGFDLVYTDPLDFNGWLNCRTDIILGSNYDDIPTEEEMDDYYRDHCDRNCCDPNSE